MREPESEPENESSPRGRAIQPAGWAAPKGYTNGWLAPAGARLLAIAGQIAWDAEQRLVSGGFAAQFRQALANVLAVVRAAGGEPADLISLTIYVTEKRAYLGATRELGPIWRELLGRHYPAMALVVVADLLEAGALVEIQGLAALPAG
jgi:enamine deaminase RidA (YjgF/YER057c/UK114 family)